MVLLLSIVYEIINTYLSVDIKINCFAVGAFKPVVVDISF